MHESSNQCQETNSYGRIRVPPPRLRVEHTFHVVSTYNRPWCRRKISIFPYRDIYSRRQRRKPSDTAALRMHTRYMTMRSEAKVVDRYRGGVVQSSVSRRGNLKRALRRENSRINAKQREDVCLLWKKKHHPLIWQSQTLKGELTIIMPVQPDKSMQSIIFITLSSTRDSI